MQLDKNDLMSKFWSERARLYGSDARTNTNDIWLREIEISNVDRIIKTYKPLKILDFGCANGYSTIRLAKLNPQCTFSAIDINPDMIKIANDLLIENDCNNCSFHLMNIFNNSFDTKFDLIYTIRVIQNIDNFNNQKKIFNQLYKIMKEKGYFYYIESYEEGYESINNDRLKMGLSPLPIHPHLTLLSKKFDNYVSKSMNLIETTSPSSSYYLITRLVYSYIAKQNKAEIDYNHPLHIVASMVPQIGNYGPQNANLFKKK